jgi:hypothetical protein
LVLRKRRWLAVLCVVLLVVGAMLAPAAGGSAPAVLVPLAPLFGLVVIAAVRSSDPVPLWSYPAPTPRPSRAPPRQLSTK